MYLLLNDDKSVNFAGSHPIDKTLDTKGLTLVEFKDTPLNGVMDGIDIFEAFWDKDKKALVDEFGNVFKSFKNEKWVEDTEAKTKAERESKQNAIMDKVSKIIDDECKKKIYYDGLGFINGASSASRHPFHPDGEKLLKWTDKVWKKVSEIKAGINDGSIDIATIDVEVEIGKIAV
ncbi:hypothetical protein [Bathymodiolus septemdierum thioautotrophic gill symbiont]|uniref:Uncharacterized protein n=1 Tax=endosymbiont of Bathymodiolus septemdierum str. Myojin knoll TaxID=1303921 RepID=A0A0P0UQZ6_9GAMM|nr:hypothetical protein [Bathymodiolus septemdierum thioautotrophic gill symbiont]BAS67630.1 hypothetical protein BSEPE_0626 [endosymbiont of Bathymodiolus septemdierum str. Myojin knoll]